MSIKNKFINILAFGTLSVGLLGVTAATQAADVSMPEMEKCYGVAKAGQNDCEAGMDPATCDKSVIDADPNYWIYVPQGLCDKLVGGMTNPAMPPKVMNTTTGAAPDAGMAPSSLPGSMPAPAAMPAPATMPSTTPNQ